MALANHTLLPLLPAPLKAGLPYRRLADPALGAGGPPELAAAAGGFGQRDAGAAGAAAAAGKAGGKGGGTGGGAAAAAATGGLRSSCQWPAAGGWARRWQLVAGRAGQSGMLLSRRAH